MSTIKIIIILSSVALVLILVAVFSKKDNKGIKVTSEKAALHNITEEVTASGTIYPESEVKISPDVSGEIIDLYVNIQKQFDEVYQIKNDLRDVVKIMNNSNSNLQIQSNTSQIEARQKPLQTNSNDIVVINNVNDKPDNNLNNINQSSNSIV